MALLAKICAATSRCAARPSRPPRARDAAPPAASASTEARPDRQLRDELARERDAPRADARIGGEVGARRSPSRRPAGSAGARPRARRGTPSARGEAQCGGSERAGRERIGQPATGEDLRQPRDVDGFGRDQRVRQRERGVAGHRAVLAQDRGELRRVCEGARKHSVVHPRPSRPATITSGSANTVTSSAAPSTLASPRATRRRARATDAARRRPKARRRAATRAPAVAAELRAKHGAQLAVEGLRLQRGLGAQRAFGQRVDGACRLRGRRDVGKNAGIRREECGFGQGQSRSSRQLPSLTVISTRPRSSKPE